MRSCIFISFQQIFFKLGNFTNFKRLFSVMSTDFPELVHVNGWQKRWKGLLNSSWGPYEKVYTPLNDHERCIFTTCWSGLEKFFCWASNFKRLLARWVRVQASHHPIAIKSLKALTVISINFLLVISMLCKTEWSWELRTWSHKMNLIDILSTSSHYFCRKRMGATNENSNFDLWV